MTETNPLNLQSFAPVPISPISNEIRLTIGVLRTSPRDAHGVLAFKGIPYARPPVGALRWRPPHPPVGWLGVRDATEFGPRCWAPALRGPAQMGGPAGEDCLTLNVWTSAHASDDRRPVMVWFHGGGFQFGASGEPQTDGIHFAANGVVLVSVNYRLGIFGFFSHPELDGEGSASGNFGLLDQIAALRWVQANISRFGGDPGNVTIFGQSAGAMSAGLLMTSSLARSLFHKAIGQSGAFWDSDQGSIRTHEEMLARGRSLADQLGDGSIAALRALSTEDLGTRTAWGMNLDPVTAAYSPSIDGYVLTESPAAVFARGAQIDVPILAGWNLAEGFIFLKRGLPHSTPEEFRAAAVSRFGKEHLTELLKVYPVDTEPALKSSVMNLTGDTVISEQVWEWLQLHRRTGKSVVYGYQYNYQSTYAPIPAHSVEVPFVFGTMTPQRLASDSPPAGPRDRELSEQMNSYWLNFARCGDPNGPGLPPWPVYETEVSQVMCFGTTTSAEPETGTERFRFIQGLRKHGRLPETWRDTP